MAPGPAIASISTAGYAGLLAGPSSIGLTADLLTLRGALGIVVILSLLVALLASAANGRKPGQPNTTQPRPERQE
jgi:hypothetical protein